MPARAHYRMNTSGREGGERDGERERGRKRERKGEREKGRKGEREKEIEKPNNSINRPYRSPGLEKVARKPVKPKNKFASLAAWRARTAQPVRISESAGLVRTEHEGAGVAHSGTPSGKQQPPR